MWPFEHCASSTCIWTIFLCEEVPFLSLPFFFCVLEFLSLVFYNLHGRDRAHTWLSLFLDFILFCRFCEWVAFFPSKFLIDKKHCFSFLKLILYLEHVLNLSVLIVFGEIVRTFYL